MLTFPTDILHPKSERWRLTGVSVSGGIPTAGAPGQSRTDGGGFWMCWMNDIGLYSQAELKTARGVEAYLDGGSTAMVVPCLEVATRPLNVGPQAGASAAIASPAALRATSINVTMGGFARFTGGEKFSITHPTKGKRLYVVQFGGVNGTGTAQTIKIRPPLREAVTSEAIDLNTPGCVMRLANPDDFLGALDVAYHSTANPIWVEDLHAA